MSWHICNHEFAVKQSCYNIRVNCVKTSIVKNVTYITAVCLYSRNTRQDNQTILYTVIILIALYLPCILASTRREYGFWKQDLRGKIKAAS